MEEVKPVEATPISAPEQTVKSKTAEQILAEREAEIAELRQKEIQLQKQKEHWREKYERDIASQTNQPASSEEPNEMVYSDEGKLIKGEIKELRDTVRQMERRAARKEAESEFPILLTREDEFDAFLEDEENRKLSVAKAARLFLAENNLLVSEPPARKGLEKPTAGGQTPPVPGLSNEQKEEMRKNNYRQYEKLLRAGQI